MQKCRFTPPLGIHVHSNIIHSTSGINLNRPYHPIADADLTKAIVSDQKICLGCCSGACRPGAHSYEVKIYSVTVEMLVYNRKNKTKTTTTWKKTVNRNNIVIAAFLVCFQSVNCFGCTHSSPLKLQELMPSSQKLVERHPPEEFNAYGFGMSACNLQWSTYVWPLKSLCLKKREKKKQDRN